MANETSGRKAPHAERMKAVEAMLRDVPMPAKAVEQKSRWVTAEKTDPDPRSVY